MISRTLQQVSDERGEKVHGWALVATGALPADPARAKELSEWLLSEIERVLDRYHRFDVETTSLALRVETFDNYIKEGLPGAS